jgi:hypothetical protein
MDISMNEIDNITLNCFANKQQYEHVMKKNDFHKDKQFLLDKKFYKKRVIDLTKKLFRNDVDDLQLYNTFDSYTKSCINYLKFLDKTDIIQEKYSYIIDYSKTSGELDDYDISTNNMLFAKEEEVKKINLDTFVIKKNSKPKSKILPKKEDVNIKTKEHKTKGIKKKKNINNIYEEKNKKE